MNEAVTGSLPTACRQLTMRAARHRGDDASIVIGYSQALTTRDDDGIVVSPTPLIPSASRDSTRRVDLL
jgi:hypothetical protein